jgi:hypothetical protein
MTKSMPAYQRIEGQPQLSTLFKVAGINESQLSTVVNLGGHLSGAVAMGTGTSVPQFELNLPGLTTRVRNAAVSAVLEQPEARETLVGDVERDLTSLRRTVDGLAGRDENIERQVEEQVGARLRSFNQKLDRRVTLSQLESSAVVKELKDRCEKLEARLARLDPEEPR